MESKDRPLAEDELLLSLENPQEKTTTTNTMNVQKKKNFTASLQIKERPGTVFIISNQTV